MTPTEPEQPEGAVPDEPVEPDGETHEATDDGTDESGTDPDQ